MKAPAASDLKRMFVDGRWTDALAGETFDAQSPATGETIGIVSQGDRDDAEAAIAAANRVAGAVARHRDDLPPTRTLDQGKPIAESRDEVEELVQYWRNAAEDGKRLEGRLPQHTRGRAEGAGFPRRRRG